MGSNNTEYSFYVDQRYDLSRGKILGAGSFGVVCSAMDLVRQDRVAVKKVLAYCEDDWDARHALREIRLMRLMTPHPNFVSLLAVSTNPRGGELYLVMELLETDLHRILRSGQTVSEGHCKCIMKQVLEAVKAMHSVNVFHRDLKPGNILISKDCHVRVTDFGLARYMHSSTLEGKNEANPITKTVVTTLYRSPELLLSPDDMPYTAAIDLWSVGCIHAELLLRRPVFNGKNEITTIQKIFEIFGYKGNENFGFPLSSEARRLLDSKCRGPRQSWPSVLPTATPSALQVIEKLLCINPSERISAVDALSLPFFDDAEVFYDYSKSYVSVPNSSFFAFEERSMTVIELVRLIEDEVRLLSMSNYDRSELEAGIEAAAAGRLSTTPRSRSPSPPVTMPRPSVPPSAANSVTSDRRGTETMELSQEKTAPRGAVHEGRVRGDNPFANKQGTVRRDSKESFIVSSTTTAESNQMMARAILSAEVTPIPQQRIKTENKKSSASSSLNATTFTTTTSDTGQVSECSSSVGEGSRSHGRTASFFSWLLCGGGPSQVKSQNSAKYES